jgi:hypothetical protein
MLRLMAVVAMPQQRRSEDAEHETEPGAHEHHQDQRRVGFGHDKRDADLLRVGQREGQQADEHDRHDRTQDVRLDAALALFGGVAFAHAETIAR